MLGPEWRRSIFDFYTLEGAEALAEALPRFDHGRLVVHIAEMPIKCPVAPLEFTFLAEAWLRERGIRDRVEIVFVTPLDGAFTQPVASARLGAMLEERKIRVEPDFMVERIDDERQVLVSYDEREVPFDLLVTVPVNMGADFVARSGLGDELNYVPGRQAHAAVHGVRQHLRDRRRLRHPGLQGRLGGALLGRGLRRQLPAARRGRPMTGSFDGHANCFVESGDDKALLIDFNYDTEPLPGQVPAPARRPDEPAQGDPRQPPRQARVPPPLLERPASRPPDPASGPHVHGRQARTPTPKEA